MFIARDLEVSFGATPIFSNASFQLQPGNRYALTGANGAGKTTLLKVLAGDQDASAGGIEYPPNLRIGLLRQDHFTYETACIVDVVIAGKPRLAKALQRKDTLLALDALSDAEAHELAALEEVIYDEQGYTAHATAESLLTGLGIACEQHYQTMSILSGGYKLRVLLAQLLFAEPDIMLLDEPTNHLDILSIAWLEQYLIDSFRGILVFISHDKYFLRRLGTHVLDVDYRTVLLYHCGYDKHLEEKSLRYQLQQAERDNQQRQVDHLQHYIDRFGAKATKAKQAQSKQKQLDRIQLTEVQETTRMAPSIVFNPKEKPGKLVLEVSELGHAFPDKPLFQDLSFQLGRGEKCAIIGANGLGKSTIMKLLVGDFVPASGDFTWGSKTTVSYVAQDHHEALKQPQTVLEYLTEHAAGVTTQTVRNTLGQMLFQKDDVHKSVTQLSGGEAARLLLAQMMLSGANVLLLDEPTNHLDMESVAELASALKATAATVIVISHDRAFLEQVAERILVVTPTGIEDFRGTYQDYVAAASEQTTAAPASLEPDKVKKKTGTAGNGAKARALGKANKAAAKQLQQAEKQIEKLEQELAALHEALAAPDLYEQADSCKAAALNQALSKVESDLNAAYQIWENLSD